jgi:hypothetical protein
MAAYGRTHVFHHRDSSISSFEQAQAEGYRVLQTLKNPNHHSRLQLNQPTF